jgi:hypothetical protein
VLSWSQSINSCGGFLTYEVNFLFLVGAHFLKGLEGLLNILKVSLNSEWLVGNSF